MSFCNLRTIVALIDDAILDAIRGLSLNTFFCGDINISFTNKRTREVTAQLDQSLGLTYRYVYRCPKCALRILRKTQNYSNNKQWKKSDNFTS